MIFHITTTTESAVIVTAAMMIFVQAIVSVNTTKTGSHIRSNTEMTTTAVTAQTWTKTLFVLSKNTRTPIMLTNIQTPSSSTAMPLKRHSTLNSLLLKRDVADTTIQTNASIDGSAALAAAKGECKSFTATWGDVDPNIFNICDTQTKNTLQLRCPEGTGFFLGLSYSGCIPFEQWPACISSGHLEQVAVCDSKHMQQPWEYKDPNKFYVCLKETIEPTILNCEPGKGFVHAIVTTTSDGSGGPGGGSGIHDGVVDIGTASEIVGCANWKIWRNYMQCNDYF